MLLITQNMYRSYRYDLYRLAGVQIGMRTETNEVSTWSDEELKEWCLTFLESEQGMDEMHKKGSPARAVLAEVIRRQDTLTVA